MEANNLANVIIIHPINQWGTALYNLFTQEILNNIVAAAKLNSILA